MLTPRTPASLVSVAITDAFLLPRLSINREVTLPLECAHFRDTGRIDAWRPDGDPAAPAERHVFWDSDVAKWIEAAAYCVQVKPDPALEAQVDEIVALMADAQLPDGYLNSYFIHAEPDRRWSNLRDRHELYCAGHLIEAAVAYRDATGKTRFLDLMERYVDHIATVFGSAEGQRRGYPGHEEIELALVKLFRATGKQRYLDLAAFFVNERGRQPHYFAGEALERGEEPHAERFRYYQAHLPVREQTTAEGHAVRACYLYAGMADVAAETGDEALLEACRTLFANLVERRLYITGGIGSTHQGEAFTFDYDLPNEEAYAETCAAIALVFFAHRMLQIEPDSRYADAMERALYNGVLAGVSLDGKTFFYVNPLSQYPPASHHHGWVTERQEWFNCVCCPPNIARLFASLPQYLYSRSDDELYVHLYAGSVWTTEVAGRPVRFEQKSDYPWDGLIHGEFGLESPTEFTLALRLPGWCRAPALRVNGQPWPLETDRGYARIRRTWQDGDTVELDLPMPVERVAAHPHVRQNCGKIALQRGPIVYCLEEVDNGENLADIVLPDDAPLSIGYEESPFARVPVITARGRRRDPAEWQGVLYAPLGEAYYDIPILAIPYAWWANRQPGEMLVWINRA